MGYCLEPGIPLFGFVTVIYPVFVVNILYIRFLHVWNND